MVFASRKNKTLITFSNLLIVFMLISGFKNEKSELHVITFNIRYDNPDDGINRWEARVPVIKSYFSEETPDIIGMQEVMHHQLIELSRILPGYTYVGKGRDDGKQGGEYSPVFYRIDKFNLLEHSQFWLSETPEVPGSKSWDAAITRIVTWAKLEHTESGKQFFVFNTHFDHKGMEAKAMSIALLSKKISSIAGNSPVIVTGDFNIRKKVREGHSMLDRALYYNLIGEFKEKNGLTDTKTISKSPVKTAGSTGTRNFKRDASFIGDVEDAIDYIFVTNQFEVESYRVDRVMNGKIFISDHWPVVSVLNF